MNKGKLALTTIKKGTKDDSEGFEDDTEGETQKKMIVTKIIYTCTQQIPIATFFHNCTVCKKPNIYKYIFFNLKKEEEK